VAAVQPLRRTLLLLAAMLLGGAAPPLAAEPIARLSVPWWKARHELKLAEAARGPVDLVLLGDSITQDYERTGPEPFRDFRAVWQRFYGDRRVLNLGFSGDATSHLLWRILHGEIDGISPKAAVILIGANNLGRLHWSAADTMQGIETVVATTRQKLPGTKILLLGVLPSDRGAWTLSTGFEINAKLAAEYGTGKVPYVTFRDLSSLFMRGGAVDTSLYLDPKLTPPVPALHPSPEGQARMAAAIESVVSAMLGDRPHG
jgi:lysophospholipase L1-like esterase